MPKIFIVRFGSGNLIFISLIFLSVVFYLWYLFLSLISLSIWSQSRCNLLLLVWDDLVWLKMFRSVTVWNILFFFPSQFLFLASLSLIFSLSDLSFYSVQVQSWKENVINDGGSSVINCLIIPIPLDFSSTCFNFRHHTLSFNLSGKVKLHFNSPSSSFWFLKEGKKSLQIDSHEVGMTRRVICNLYFLTILSHNLFHFLDFEKRFVISFRKKKVECK